MRKKQFANSKLDTDKFDFDRNVDYEKLISQNLKLPNGTKGTKDYTFSENKNYFGGLDPKLQSVK